jgi:uncharacterized cofD-like protein
MAKTTGPPRLFRRLWAWLVPAFGLKRYTALWVLASLWVATGAGDLLRRAWPLARLEVHGPLSPTMEALFLMALGVVAGAFALRGILAAVRAWALRPGPEGGFSAYPEAVLKSRGPRVVVIGGGTGLSVLLRGLKAYTWNITAIVAVTDDGGSSGRLRRELSMPPPGDIRNCLVALADTEPLMERLLQHRMEGGQGLAGHAFGNLFLAAMTEITGDFEQAVRASSRVLAVRGRVLPSTLRPVTLRARLADGTVVEGETAIARSARKDLPIEHVELVPSQAEPLDEALLAMAEADLIVLGPGSLYTSVVPNLLVRGMAQALRASQALRVHVANIMTQHGETDGMSAADHTRALLRHGATVDVVVVNTRPLPPAVRARYAAEGSEPVAPALEELRAMGLRTVPAPLWDVSEGPARHDADALARLLLSLLGERQRGRRRMVGHG